MEDRSVMEWDKNDLEALGILKIDILRLGKLSCIRKGLIYLNTCYKANTSVATILMEDPAVNDMICRADTTGVFQIKNRAQMTMQPQLQSRNLYDLVIEVSIICFGPI